MKGEHMKDQIIQDLKSKSMNLKTLASDMGCSYEHLLYVLNGHRPMSYKVATKLCASLNIISRNSLCKSVLYSVAKFLPH